jgi:phage FluMu protein Com
MQDTEQYVEVRCKICNVFICEVTVESTGQIKRKCARCKHDVKISLPLRQKTNTILAGRNVHPA